MVGPAQSGGPLASGPPSVAFGPDSEAWRLNREALLLMGVGPRALLLQVAHPSIAEGVDRYSGFREDPWARLASTLRSYLRIVYGPPGATDAEVARLARLHRPIRGDVRDATARARGFATYRATDPDLGLWVHATLIDSTIVAYDAWLEPLDRERRARYYAETLPLGRAFGIPSRLLPPDLDAFESYLARMAGPGGPVSPTPTARELAMAILHPRLGTLHPALGSIRPLLDALPPPAYDWAMWPALGLLPERIRDGYGIPYGPFRRVVAAWLVAGWRTWRPLLPPSFRQMSQALAADRRAARLAGSAGH